jgi:hypothetical protein
VHAVGVDQVGRHLEDPLPGRQPTCSPCCRNWWRPYVPNPATSSFTAYRQLDEPRTYVLLERYTSREAFAAHRETDHFKELVLGEIVPRLDERVTEMFDATE